MQRLYKNQGATKGKSKLKNKFQVLNLEPKWQGSLIFVSNSILMALERNLDFLKAQGTCGPGLHTGLQVGMTCKYGLPS